MANNTTRRAVTLGITALGSLAANSAFAAVLTPRASEGPFYPTPSMRPADIDNDLVKIRSVVEAAKGEVISLRGVFIDPEGAPRADHRVEIWQCDTKGVYLHTNAPRAPQHDQGFQGFGHDITDAEGRFSFRTIKPAIYPGRAPHIHVRAINREGASFSTQFYIKDHPANQRDILFRRMTSRQANAVSMAFRDDAGETITDITIAV